MRRALLHLLLISSFSAVLALVLGGTAAAEQPWTNDPKGAIAKQVAPLYWAMFGIATVVLFIVDGALIYAGIKFRERPGVTAKQFHGHNALELMWTVVPTVIVIGLAVFSFERLIYINDVDSGTEMTVEVTGKQWSWEYRYPLTGPAGANFQTLEGPLVTGEELHIPAGTKVKLALSATDVIHSFWVPKLGGKMDAVPGRDTALWLYADEPGTYKGQCTEFCGDGHADMLITVVVHPQSEYAAWAREAVRAANVFFDPATKKGREIFMAGQCPGCHLIRNTPAVGKIGPELTQFGNKRDIAGAVPNTIENLTRWVDNAPAVKPGTKMPAQGLTGEDARAVAQFLSVLGKTSP